MKSAHRELPSVDTKGHQEIQIAIELICWIKKTYHHGVNLLCENYSKLIVHTLRVATTLTHVIHYLLQHRIQLVQIQYIETSNIHFN